jgi:hypothetical protein
MLRFSTKRFGSFALVLVCAFAFGTASFVSAVHTHKMEAKSSDHCNLCQVGQQIRTGNAPQLQKAPLPIVEKTTVPEIAFSSESFFIPSAKLSQAPPVLS